VEIWLSAGGTDKIQIPVNPQTIGYESSNNFEDIVLASGDEKTIIGGRNLKPFTIESFFPARRVSYMATSKFSSPMGYVKRFEKWSLDKKVLQLLVTGTNINHRVTIRSFKWNENGGAVGDIDYALELKEYKPISYSAIKVVTSKKGSSSSKTSKRPTSQKQMPKTHIVKTNESLWTIAKKYYGDGNKGEAIYLKNKSLIGPNKNHIHPGMRLILP